jgi:hypothetical protein
MYTEEQMSKAYIIGELEELSAEELDEQLGTVSYYQREVTLATLHRDELDPQLMESWTALAQKLSSEWIADPASRGTGIKISMKGGTILRKCTPTEIFDSLVENIRQKRSSANWKEKEDAKTAAEVRRFKEEVQHDIQEKAIGGFEPAVALHDLDVVAPTEAE